MMWQIKCQISSNECQVAIVECQILSVQFQMAKVEEYSGQCNAFSEKYHIWQVSLIVRVENFK